MCYERLCTSDSTSYDVRITVGCFLIVALGPLREWYNGTTARVGFHHGRAVGDEIIRGTTSSLESKAFARAALPQPRSTTTVPGVRCCSWCAVCGGRQAESARLPRRSCYRQRCTPTFLCLLYPGLRALQT
jgi:hypothetical protein